MDKKFEYTIDTLKLSPERLKNHLKLRGTDGWELVDKYEIKRYYKVGHTDPEIIECELIFKREY